MSIFAARKTNKMSVVLTIHNASCTIGARLCGNIKMNMSFALIDTLTAMAAYHILACLVGVYILLYCGN